MKNEPWNQDPRSMVFYDCAQMNVPIPGHLGFSEISAQMNIIMPQALKGEKPVVQLLADVSRIVDQKLAELNKR